MQIIGMPLFIHKLKYAKHAPIAMRLVVAIVIHSSPTVMLLLVELAINLIHQHAPGFSQETADQVAPFAVLL
jgi:hypothetical protein